MRDSFEDFKMKLLNPISLEMSHPFLYVDPPCDWKAPFIVDAEHYLDFFEKMIVNAHSHGYCISFIVGDPGAGKTHFLCHLNYLHYVSQKFNGLYSIYSAGEKKITPEELWRDFFSNMDVVNRLQQLLPPEEVKVFKFPHLGMKETILAYIENPNTMEGFEPDKLLNMAIGVSNLLQRKGVHICMVIDNIDEYFRWLNSLRLKGSNEDDGEKNISGVEPTKEDLNAFFGTLRIIATNMRSFLLLVSLTRPAYTPIPTISVDRTLAGRIIYQSEVLGPLTRSQTYELVYKYMNYWTNVNDIELPVSEECLVESSSGEKINIFPFAKVALEEIYDITGQYARDIKMICSEAIDEMRYQKDVWIVKDEHLAYAVDEAHRRRPQIVPLSKVNEFKRRRVEWLKPTMQNRIIELKKRATPKYRVLDPIELSAIFDSYIRSLNIEVDTNIPSIPNWENPNNLTDPSSMRILKYIREGEIEKRILASYVFSDKPPLGQTLFRKIEIQDLSDAISYVEQNHATYIIFICHWSGTWSENARKHYHKISRYDSVIDELHIDKCLWEIIASVRESKDEKEQRDLVEHVDKYYLKLRQRLDQLILKSIPPLETYEEKQKRMRKEAAQRL